MKKVIILIVLLSSLNLFAQKIKVKVDGNNVLANGEKICSIVEDADYNGIKAKIQIKDKNDVTRLYVGEKDYRMYYADDQKSYLGRYKASGGMFASDKKLIGEFFANSGLFPTTGYDGSKKFQAIQKSSGGYYDPKTDKVLTKEIRDKSAQIYISGFNKKTTEYEAITQGGYEIAEIRFLRWESSKFGAYFDKKWFEVINSYGVKVAEFCRYFNCGGCDMPSYDIHSVSGQVDYLGKGAVSFDEFGMVDYIYHEYEMVAGKQVSTTTYQPTKVAAYINAWRLFDLKEDGTYAPFKFVPDLTAANNAPITTPENNSQKTPTALSTTTPAPNNTTPTTSVSNNTTSSPSGFSTYSTKSSEKLEAMKKDAVAKNDFDAAAAIKTELDLRKAEQEKVANFQKDLDEKVKAEDYAGASKLQKEIGPFKEKIAKKDQLRKDIDAAVASQDYEKAEQLKQELKALY